jgi:hypothetical protein
MAADPFVNRCHFLQRRIRLPIDLEKPSRSYRKVFIRNPNNTHWVENHCACA